MLSIGTILDGRYRVVSQGVPWDIGTTYRTYDMQHDELADVLLLDPRFGSDPKAVDRLGMVSEAVDDLVQSSLVPFDQIGVIDGQLYLARSHAEAQTLADLLAQTGPLRFDAAVEIAIRMCEALAPAHQAGLVHGSLSPHSVLLEADGQLAVTDAGLFPALRQAHAPSGQPWGRFPYLSPEQAAGEDAHPTSDVYVLGLLLYEMLSGQPPFQGGDATSLALQHLRQEPVALQALVPQIPFALAQIVHKALAKEPAARYRNAAQLAHILRSQVGVAPAVAAPAVSDRGPARQRLVVPPPPAAYPPTETYLPDAETGYQVEEPAAVDWLLIGLIIAAIIVILGLIPLWRTVYRRYAVPPGESVPGSYYRLEDITDLSPTLRAFHLARDRSERASGRVLGCSQGSSDPGVAAAPVKPRWELDESGLVWYNWKASIPAFVGFGSSPRRAADFRVWESSLRVSRASCCTL
jgi:serine/threonine protein kinase